MEISTTDRVFIAGATGSGKSFFARQMLRTAPRLVVIDPTGLIRDPVGDWQTTDKGDAGLRKLDKPKAVARVYVEGPVTEAAWEKLFDRLLELRNTVIYLDELYAIGPATNSPGLRALYTRGRHFGLGVWGVSQRPKRIPLFCISEAEYKVIFRLELVDDRDFMAKMMHPIVDEPLHEHGFIIKGPNRIIRYRKGLRIAP